MEIQLSPRFRKAYQKAPREIKLHFEATLELFQENPLNPHPKLRKHSLRKEYAGYYSIDITGDWRAIFKVKKTKKQTIITFHVLGTHTQLYGR